jgi:DNA-binding NarL/FixJ family response regulator
MRRIARRRFSLFPARATSRQRSMRSRTARWIFIEKPFRGAEVVDRVRSSIERRARSARNSFDVRLLHFPGREALTIRECDVLEHLAAGASNKEAARALGISPRTIELRRAHVISKLGAKIPPTWSASCSATAILARFRSGERHAEQTSATPEHREVHSCAHWVTIFVRHLFAEN